MSFAERFDSDSGVVRALADDHAALRGLLAAPRRRRPARRGSARRGPAAPSRRRRGRGRGVFGSKLPSTTPRATSSATAAAPPSRTAASGVEPDREGLRRADRRAGAPPRRRRGGPSRDRACRRRPALTVRTRPAAISPGAATSEVKRFARSSPNAARAASSPPVRRFSSPRGPSKVGLTDDRDGEDVGLDVPRLVGDDAQLHGWGLLVSRAGRHGRRGRVSGRSVPGGRSGVRAPAAAGASEPLGAVGARPARPARRRSSRSRPRRLELAPRLLDPDHRLVQPAPADLGEDDHEPLRVRRQQVARLAARRRTPARTSLVTLPFDVDERLVEVAERRVVLGVPSSHWVSVETSTVFASASRNARAWAMRRSDSSSFLSAAAYFSCATGSRPRRRSSVVLGEERRHPGRGRRRHRRSRDHAALEPARRVERLEREVAAAPASGRQRRASSFGPVPGQELELLADHGRALLDRRGRASGPRPRPRRARRDVRRDEAAERRPPQLAELGDLVRRASSSSVAGRREARLRPPRRRRTSARRGRRSRAGAAIAADDAGGTQRRGPPRSRSTRRRGRRGRPARFIGAAS